MPWLFPLALGLGIMGLGWAIFGGRSSGTPLVTRRNPLLPPQNPQQGSQNPRPMLPARPSLQPVTPSAPGVQPGMQQATADAERAQDAEVIPPQRPDVTYEPIDPDAPPVSTVPGLVSESPRPQRPPVPPSIQRERERSAAVARSANPEVVEEHAHGALGALRSRTIAPAARSEFLRRFQDAYGQGLRPDGVYGPNTRRALALVLGPEEARNLPALPRR